MSDFEKRVRSAFDAVSAPDALVERTLASIESERRAQGEPTDEAVNGVHNGGFQEKSAQVDVEPAVRAAARRHRRMRMVAAASLAAVLVCGSASAVYANESAYVQVSGESSIELAVNRFGVIVRGTVHDSELQESLDAIGVVGKSYEDAVALLVEQGFVTDLAEGAPIEFYVTCSSERQSEALEQATEKCLQDNGVEGARCTEVSEEERAEALENGMGISKYRSYEELKSLGSDISAEQCREMSMKEIREAIAAAGGIDHAGNGAAKGSQGVAGESGSGESGSQGTGAGYASSDPGKGNGSGAGNGNSEGHGSSQSGHGNREERE